MESLDLLAREYRGQLMPVELDVNDESADRAVVEQVMEDLGRIDVVVNNAGYENLHSDLAHGELLERVQTNLFGALWISQYAARFMQSAGRGQIVQVFPREEIDRCRAPALFDRARYALEGFSESLAREFAPFGLHILIGAMSDCSS